MSEEIINGIDVSGCCLYKDGICLTDKGKCTSMCDYGAYAREEELKRLEQENAKLKEKLEKIKEKCKFFISKCNECENPDITIDCIDCTTGGKAIASYKILNIIEDIEGVEDDK